MTLLVHLGYLTYDEAAGKVRIPNKEVSKEYLNGIEDTEGLNFAAKAMEKSRKLLTSLWNMDEDAVASGLETAHQEMSNLQYNDENALSYTISLAFYYAREYYTIVREMPAGKGYADVCFIPRKAYGDKPAILIELKWDKDADTAIRQIRDKRYPAALQEYEGDLLVVGVNYDKGTKKHECIIEKWKK